MCNCNTKSEFDKKHSIQCSQDAGRQYNSQISFVCADPKCRVAFCRFCIKELLKWGPSVARADDQYRLWLKRNKTRKLRLLKDTPTTETREEYDNSVGGLTHELWLEKKAEEAEEKEERVKNSQTGPNDGNAPPKKGTFIHNLDYDRWAEIQKERLAKKK